MSSLPSSRTLLPLSAALLALACGAGPTTSAVAPPPPMGGSASASPAGSSLPPETTIAGIPAPAPGASSSPPQAVHHAAAELAPSLATAHAPEVFKARFTTTRGAFVIEAHRAWAPNGADRFYNLVKLGFFDDTRFFRVIDGFMAQFGINGEPAVSAQWQTANIPDDPVAQSNRRGYVTFAQTSAPNSRATQIFVNTADNTRLDASRFAPFGVVVSGMSVVESLYHEYGEGKPSGSGPDQGRIQEGGNTYLDGEYPRLDRILSTQLL